MNERVRGEEKSAETESELANQLRTYADGLTAFSFVQSAAFCLLMVQSATAACAIRSRWSVPALCLLVAGAGYLVLLCLCHRGEGILSVRNVPSEKINKIVPIIWGVRFVIVGLARLGEVAVVLAAHSSSPLFGCSKRCSRARLRQEECGKKDYSRHHRFRDEARAGVTAF
jgi:hypothetical protein